MSSNITLREFCNRYKNGEYAAKDRKTQIAAGWYDWFCEDEELAERLWAIWEVLEGVKSDFILDNFRVSFKNHCPVCGPLYDTVDFFCLDEDRDGLSFGVTIDDEREKGKYAVYTARNDYRTETYTDDVQEVQRFINNWKTALHDKTFYEKYNKKQAAMKELADGIMKEFGLN